MSDVVVVLGMHRSGTSAVAGTLTKLGGAAPKHFMGADANNARGYFESLAFMEFHNELLDSAGSHWEDWRLFNPGWYGSPIVAGYKQRAKELLAAEFGSAALPVLKDPRICRFVPFWLDVLRELRATPRIVMPIRSPLDVARSLKTRNGFSLTKGLLLWLRHVLDAEASSRSEARSIFGWGEFNADWRGVCDKIAADTGLAWPRLSDRTSREIEDFLSRDLIHHESDRATLLAHSEVHEWTVSVYEALLELARNPFSNSALATIDQVRALLDQSSRMFGRVLADYEIDLERQRGESARDKEALAQTLAAVVAERDELFAERAQLATELHTRQQEFAEQAAVLAGFADRTDAAERALAEAVGDNELLRQALGEAEAAQADLAADTDRAMQKHRRLALHLHGAMAELADSRRDFSAMAQSHAEIEATLFTVRHEKAALETARAELAGNLDRVSAELQNVERTSAERASATASAHARALAAMQTTHDSELRALRIELVDAEAALSHATAPHPRAGRLSRLLPSTVRRRLLAHQLVRSGLLDVKWYAATYPDVAENGLSPAEHYLETGFCRGYRPNPLFDTHYYLERHEDVRRSGVNPLLHYLLHGWREGRDPGPSFQTDYYLEDNPDVRAQGINPLMHYLRYGRHEGRLPVRPA